MIQETPCEVLAVIAHDQTKKSVRQEMLPEDAVNLLKYAFEELQTLMGRPCAIEVRLDDPVNHLLHGGDGLVVHSGSNSEKYFKHIDDPEWAVVYRDDCLGVSEEGQRIEAEIRLRTKNMIKQLTNKET